jgi:hypothetical protein
VRLREVDALSRSRARQQVALGDVVAPGDLDLVIRPVVPWEVDETSWFCG